jgi:hypothetical protein
MVGVSFIISIILLIIWKIGNHRDVAKAEKMAHDFYHGTNTLRQQELYGLFYSGMGLDGKPLTAPHKCPKEVQRLVKIQLEKEGYRYANDNFWNLDHAVFDDEGNLVTLGGRKVDPLTGQVML